MLTFMIKIKELWEELQMWYEKMMWQSSPERKQLATARLEALKRYTHQPPGGNLRNPYLYPEDYEFF